MHNIHLQIAIYNKNNAAQNNTLRQRYSQTVIVNIFKGAELIHLNQIQRTLTDA